MYVSFAYCCTGWYRGLGLADLTLSSSFLPPLLTASQFVVLAICITSSGRTGIEFTNEIEGKKHEAVSSKSVESTVSNVFFSSTLKI